MRELEPHVRDHLDAIRRGDTEACPATCSLCMQLRNARLLDWDADSKTYVITKGSA
jgi:hypothetical protein